MDIYTENILDYFKNPRNKGPLTNATISTTENNPLCGDQVTIHLKFDSKNKLEQATFEGHGCAISQAATSMLTEYLTDKSLEEIKKIENDEIYEMLQIPISPARVKCALLGLVATKKAAILAEHQVK